MNEEQGASLAIRDTARIAVYDDLLSAPRVVDIPPQGVHEFIEAIAVAVYELSRQQGGLLPYTVIREITENFIHAGFLECTVSILDEGNTLRFADQGPGILKKNLVLEPGISSATRQMKEYIRGVGSGFPIVREYLTTSQGSLRIEDNAGEGVVVTISLLPSSVDFVEEPLSAGEARVPSGSRLLGSTLPGGVQNSNPAERASFQSFKSAPLTGAPHQEADQKQRGLVALGHPSSNKLSEREVRALFFLNEHEELGPVSLAALLKVSAPTATRLLKRLEQLDLVVSTPLKKRILSSAGRAHLQELQREGFLL